MRIVTVPVKSLSRTKSRLASVLSPIERGALTLAMLEDVLDATLQLAAWETWIVSSDEVVLEVAVRRGARPVREPSPTLQGAIRHVDMEATARDADAMAVVLADTPMLTADALAVALHTMGPVVLAPSADRSGTNLLLRRPPRAIRPLFGSDSFTKHRSEAASKQLPVAIVEAPQIAFDLDVPDDILTLMSSGVHGRTLDVCTELELEDRLRVRT
ncbi:MAG: 2-phospho-L-lactate guanylyltransferase [Actinomycetota bacterium]